MVTTNCWLISLVCRVRLNWIGFDTIARCCLLRCPALRCLSIHPSFAIVHRASCIRFPPHDAMDGGTKFKFENSKEDNNPYSTEIDIGYDARWRILFSSTVICYLASNQKQLNQSINQSWYNHMCPLALYGVLSNQNECDEMRCVQSFMLALSLIIQCRKQQQDRIG